MNTPPTEGYPDDNPKTAFGIAKVPLHLVPPIAIANISLAFDNGAKKYGPFNWREKTISSTVYYAAAMRHLMAWFDGEDLAPDSGVHHLAHVMACCAMVLDSESVGKHNDNRPTKGGFPKMLAEYGQPPTPPAPVNTPIKLLSFGKNKITVVKALREINGYSLKDAVDLVNDVPSKVEYRTSRFSRAEAVLHLIEAGATVS